MFPFEDKRFHSRELLAHIYKELRDFGQAIAIFKELLHIDSTAPDILLGLGDSYYVVELYKDLTFHDDFPEIHRPLAFALLSQEDFEKALLHYQFWIEDEPADIRALIGIAECHFGLEKFDAAEQYVRDVLRIDPSNSDALSLISRINNR
jgi:tetratricopeptide (TPR) repeat protein